MDLGADEVKAILGVEPHPTCGFVAGTERSSAPVGGDEVPGFTGIRLHRIRNDQLYHHHLGGTFHTSRLPEGGWALLASTGWPGIEPQDVEQGDPGRLAATHPDAAGWLRDLSPVSPS